MQRLPVHRPSHHDLVFQCGADCPDGKQLSARSVAIEPDEQKLLNATNVLGLMVDTILRVHTAQFLQRRKLSVTLLREGKLEILSSMTHINQMDHLYQNKQKSTTTTTTTKKEAKLHK